MRRLPPRLCGPRLLAALAVALGGCFASAQAADEVDQEVNGPNQDAAQAAGAGEAGLPAPSSDPVDFARDVQPLLAKHCHSCHGAEMAEASLRLDTKDDALRGGNSGPALVPGNSADSRLIRYVTGLNEDEIVMPPDGERLSAAEIGLVRAWIDQGAAWPDELADAQAGSADHWSFKPIQPLAVPQVADAGRVRNGIDAFVLARLEGSGLEPSPEADRATLIRRLSIDLLGLPPAPAEVDAFLSDARPDAYERLVDRLLASPHYGERWGRHWLDLARYADSDGYEKDTGRPHAWRYRNWVIDALNRDLPFNQFTTQQLAGDLLGDDESARIATGFHRNTLTNREGGVDPEEDRVKKTVDRVNTTGSIWLGLTVGCAQCHTHKYDPLAQREYYGLFAFFNNLDEVDVPAPLPEQVAAYREAKQVFDQEQANLAAEVERFEREVLASRQVEWEKNLDLNALTVWTVLESESATSAGGATLKTQGDGSLLVEGKNPDTDTYTITAATDLAAVTGLRLEVLSDPSLPAKGPGRVSHGNFVLSELRLAATPAGAAGEPQAVELAGGQADFAQDGFPPASAIDGDTKSGWAVAPQFGRDHVAVFETKQPPAGEGSRQLTVTLDQQHGEQHTIGRLRISITPSGGPLDAKGISSRLAGILAKPAVERTADELSELTEYFRNVDPELAKLKQALAEHAAKAPVDPGTLTKAQAVAQTSTPRETHILLRGDFLQPGARVEPHTPAVLHTIKPRGPQPDRLDLALWLIDPANPLTARVTVNRVWARHLGRGLVSTDDDFGTQGEPPSHPELLDWLAGQFIANDWSLKALHKLIVTSATYRQSSRTLSEHLERDPSNVLLARQRRLRVEAEVIRDLSLAASGLLNPTIGGASVHPPQPAGISELTYADSAKWVESSGPDRYRRGMYTWFQRTSPYPMLMTFDAPDSNVACTRRERSNTPLQALTLLNDPVFFECAQALARRIVAEADGQPTGPAATDGHADRLRYAFRLCLARSPSDDELADLAALYAAELSLCQADAASATQLAGSQARPVPISDAELAAWVVVGRTLLNLDEFITRE